MSFIFHLHFLFLVFSSILRAVVRYECALVCLDICWLCAFWLAWYFSPSNISRLYYSLLLYFGIFAIRIHTIHSLSTSSSSSSFSISIFTIRDEVARFDVSVRCIRVCALLFFIGFCLFNKIAFARNSCELHDVISLFMNTEKARDLKWNVFFFVFFLLTYRVCMCTCSPFHFIFLCFCTVCLWIVFFATFPFSHTHKRTHEHDRNQRLMRVIPYNGSCILQKTQYHSIVGERMLKNFLFWSVCVYVSPMDLSFRTTTTRQSHFWPYDTCFFLPTNIFWILHLVS